MPRTPVLGIRPRRMGAPPSRTTRPRRSGAPCPAGRVGANGCPPCPTRGRRRCRCGRAPHRTRRTSNAWPQARRGGGVGRWGSGPGRDGRADASWPCAGAPSGATRDAGHAGSVAWSGACRQGGALRAPHWRSPRPSGEGAAGAKCTRAGRGAPIGQRRGRASRRARAAGGGRGSRGEKATRPDVVSSGPSGVCVFPRCARGPSQRLSALWPLVAGPGLGRSAPDVAVLRPSEGRARRAQAYAVTSNEAAQAIANGWAYRDEPRGLSVGEWWQRIVDHVHGSCAAEALGGVVV
jgi:hypothetical protein